MSCLSFFLSDFGRTETLSSRLCLQDILSIVMVYIDFLAHLKTHDCNVKILYWGTRLVLKLFIFSLNTYEIS